MNAFQAWRLNGSFFAYCAKTNIQSPTVKIPNYKHPARKTAGKQIPNKFKISMTET